ncbi:CPBP family intramembrane glutamic endopeptidase [Acidithiobacillus sp.]|uniref:CPBP family intramembrane glutamic endopeptidase n=1 Tax=Acidithiobacillus sp. TaxID=1872118 RepID=UPI0025B971FB|nr:CPBP family intramembrane glutamic endopeptidase [Acidithiobacillus sp.]
MTAAWRSLRPGFFLRDNLYATSGGLFFVVLAVGLSLSNTRVDPWHPNHAWAAMGTRTSLGLGFLMLGAGMFTHYWRTVAEPLVFPVPRFRRDHRWLFSALLGLLAVFGFFVLLHRQAAPTGAVLLPLIFLLGGAVLATLPISLSTPAGSATRGLRLLVLSPFYLLIFSGPIYWRIGTLPPNAAVPLALLIAGFLGLGLLYTPRELRAFLDLRGSARRRVPSLRLGRWSKAWAWTPPGWRFAPWVYGPRLYGILGSLLQQGIGLAALAFSFSIALAFASHVPAGADIPDLVIVRTLTFASIFGLAWGSWTSRPFEWQYLLLTGAWGDHRETMLARWMQDFARHLLLLVAASLLIPFLVLIYLQVPIWTILATLTVFTASLVINAYLPMAAVAITGAFRGVRYGLLVGTGAVINMLVLNFLLAGSLLAPSAARTQAPVWDVSASLVALLFVLVAHQGVKGRLGRADWLLTGLGRGPARHVGPTMAPTRERPWTPLAALLLMIAFFLGQPVVAAFAVFARGFWIGLELGARYGVQHLKPPVALLHARIAELSLDFRVWTGLLAYILTAAALLGFLRWYLSREQWRSPQGIGWCPASTVRAYPVALMLALLLFGLSALLVQIFPPPTHLSPQTLGVFDAFHMTGWPRYLMIFLSVILAPVVEEIVFRGAGLAGLRQRLSPWLAGGIVSLLFVLVHLPSKVDNFHYPEALIPIAALALALLWLRLKYRSLWPGIFLHASWNGAAVLATLLH